MYMDMLFEKIEKLKDVLDQNEDVMTIRELNRKIYEDSQLVGLLEEYASSHDENVKKKIIDSELFREYKKKETDINIIILQINKKLKKISSKDMCC